MPDPIVPTTVPSRPLNEIDADIARAFIALGQLYAERLAATEGGAVPAPTP